MDTDPGKRPARFEDRLLDSRRLAALHATELLDAPAPGVVQELCDLLRDTAGVDAAAVTLVDRDRQVFVAAAGLPEPWATTRETDLAHCLCQHVIAQGTTVVMDDLDEIDLTEGSLAAELGIGAYVGHPLVGPGGEVLGATCAIASRPRLWSRSEQRIVETLGRTINHVLLTASATPPPPASDEIAMVAHDLRSPLTVLVGASRQLASSAITLDTRRELGRMVDRASHQLEELVDDLLTAARPTDRTNTFTRQPVHVTDLLHELAHHTRATHGVTIDVDAPDPVTIYSDPRAVERIVQNLLENAVRHGEPPFRIGLTTAADGATIAVSNHGPSIDDDTHARLFGRFRPGSSTTSRTGLGLHIVWRLTNALGGTVRVDEDGEATVFRVVLPQRGQSAR